MFKKFIQWTRIYVLIGILASTMIGIPVQASGAEPGPIRETKSFAAPPRPVLLSPAKGALVKNITPILKWKDSGADHYRIQITSDIDFLNIVRDDIVTREQIITGILYSPTLPPGKRLYWRVMAFSAADEASPWSAVWNFRTPLIPPVLLTPTTGESLLTDRPTFTWNAATSATQYILQVSAASNFSSLLVNTTVVGNTNTQFTIGKDLPQNKTLYWRVRSKSATLVSGFSPKRAFKTGNPPTVPVLLKPVDNALVYIYTPLLDWQNSANPAGMTFKQYEIEVDNNSDFSSPEIPNTPTTLNDINASAFTPPSDLTPNTKYYWRVRAINTVFNTTTAMDEDHTSGWSKAFSFRVAIPAPTSLTVLSTDNPVRPNFDWDDAAPPFANYTIQISISPNFSSFLVNGTIVPSNYKLISNLPTGRPIYLRVRVNGANGPSAWTNLQFTAPVLP